MQSFNIHKSPFVPIILRTPSSICISHANAFPSIFTFHCGSFYTSMDHDFDMREIAICRVQSAQSFIVILEVNYDITRRENCRALIPTCLSSLSASSPERQCASLFYSPDFDARIVSPHAQALVTGFCTSITGVVSASARPFGWRREKWLTSRVRWGV